MMRAIALLACALPLGAIEITTGYLLGPKYDARSFYVREGGGAWTKTYSGPANRREAQGKLMNLRLAQALYHDEWLNEIPFSPEENTSAVIAALDTYKAHGVLMINVSMQGGQAGEEGRIYGLGRRNGYKFGPGAGTHVSAFRPDGSLKPDWLARLARLLTATNERGMIVNLMYFYQGQDELFDGPEAIFAAARNLTDWLIDRNARNVVIDVANEWDLRGEKWDLANTIPDNIVQLINAVRDRYQKRKIDWAPPISASTDGRMLLPASFTSDADIVLLHGNGRTPLEKRARFADFRKADRPVLMNEDDNGRVTTEPTLARELSSCDAAFELAAGWGYMPWVQAQKFPFRWMPAAGAVVRDSMPEPERDLVYFHAVLDHIASLVFKKPPKH